MKRLLLFLIIPYSLISSAQVNFYDTQGEHTIRINANGALGVDLTNLSPASFYDGNPYFPLIRQAGLWIIAQDINGNYHTATHFQNEVDAYDFWAGPVDTLTGQTSENAKWNNVWTVTKTEIDNHKENFNSTSYQTPNSISTWPAIGSEGFATYLAPFIDVNNDGIYNPELGDYPDIKGVESSYCIFNDLQGEHKASLGQEIGLEVNLLVSKLEKNSSALFLEYFVINRRPTEYLDVKAGFFIDAECGNRSDNYAGSFSLYPQSIFVYNGDLVDEGFFGNEKPFIYATFQNENLSNSISFNDSEKKNGTPALTTDFINFSNSRWKDSSSLTVGGDGTTGSLLTNYIFDQSTPGSNFFWREEDQPNPLGERSIVGFTRRNDFRRNDFIKLNILLDVGKTSEVNTVEVIKDKSITSNLKYNQSSSSTKLNRPNIKIYPNPSAGEFTIESPEYLETVKVFNSLGQVLVLDRNVGRLTHKCNTLPHSGVYYVSIETASGSIVEKLILTE